MRVRWRRTHESQTLVSFIGHLGTAIVLLLLRYQVQIINAGARPPRPGPAATHEIIRHLGHRRRIHSTPLFTLLSRGHLLVLRVLGDARGRRAPSTPRGGGGGVLNRRTTIHQRILTGTDEIFRNPTHRRRIHARASHRRHSGTAERSASLDLLDRSRIQQMVLTGTAEVVGYSMGRRTIHSTDGDDALRRLKSSTLVLFRVTRFGCRTRRHATPSRPLTDRRRSTSGNHAPVLVYMQSQIFIRDDKVTFVRW